MSGRWVLTFLAIFVLLLTLAGKASAIEWITDFDAGLDEATERGAPIFVCFVQRTCNPSMNMYHGILRNSSAVNALAKDFVCLLAYKEVNPDAWRKGSVYFLDQSFYTPTYIFTDSNAKELLPVLRKELMHKEFPEARLISTMKKVLRKVGKGIPRSRWRAVRNRLDRAETAFEDADSTTALRLLEQIIEKNEVPSLTARAKRRRDEILDHAFLLAESARLDHNAAIRRLSHLARAYAGRPEGHEARRKLAEHGIKELPDVRPNDEIAENTEEVYRGAVSAALRGDLITARDELTFFLEGTGEPERFPRHVALRERLAARAEGTVTAGKIKVTKIHLRNTGQYYWEIGVTVASKLVRIDRLAIQYWALTDESKVFAGYREFENVGQGKRHQHAAFIPFTAIKTWTLPDGTMKGEKVRDVRFEIFVSNEVIANASLVEEPESQWWTQDDVEPLAFMDVPGWGWDSGTLSPTGEMGIVYGRAGESITPEPEKRPTLPERIEAAIGQIGQSVDHAEIGTAWRELLDIGDAAVEPLKRALDPEGGEFTVNYAMVLCDMQAKGAIPNILKLLGSKDNFLREEIPSGLIRFGDAHVVPVEVLVKQLDDELMWPRHAAALTLGYLRDEKAVEPLIARLAKEPDPTARGEMITALTRITVRNFNLDGNRSIASQDEAYRKLTGWWKNHSGQKREEWMVSALKDAGYKAPKVAEIKSGRVSVKVVDALRKAALDERWWISYAALRLLAGLNDPGSIPTFLDVLGKRDRDDIQYAVVNGIRASAHRDSLEYLISAAEENDRLVDDILGVLESLFGIYSMPVIGSKDPVERMAPWRDWFEENEFYIYRPEGSPRFLLNEKAKEEATLVDPVTGKPEE